MIFNDRRKKSNPVIAAAMSDIKARSNETAIARKNAKSAMKDVKKAGANTPEFKAIMKGKIK